MSITSLDVSAKNPVRESDVIEAVKAIGPDLTLTDQELSSYFKTVSAVWETSQEILQAPDYYPQVDLERFPRQSVHRPKPEDNPTNGFAWRCEIKDARPNQGILQGRTICVKDNVAVAGVPCLLGTEVFTDWTPNVDATIVTRLLKAGATIVGKSVCENLSVGSNSTSSSTGPIHNPHANGYSAGGSSSGSAALVANGGVWAAVSGDQGGSIRLPASNCGLVGLKPTAGLIPFTGIASIEPTLDYTGPITKTVMDSALFLQATAGVDGIDDRQQAGCPFPDQVPDYPSLASRSIKGMKIGVVKEGFSTPCSDTKVNDCVMKAVECYEQLGAIVEEVSIPSHTIAAEAWSVICRLGAMKSMTNGAFGRRQLYMNDLTAKMESLQQPKGFAKALPAAKNVLICGKYMDMKLESTLLGKAFNLERMCRDHYNQALDKYDVLIMPTVPHITRKHANAHGPPLEYLAACSGSIYGTAPFNATGRPAISIPVGKVSPADDADVKLPVGMQIVSKWWRDDLVLQFAHAWESNNDWTRL